MRGHAAGAAVALAVIFAIAGCTADGATVETGTPSPTATAVPELTFDDGAALDPAQTVAWSDPLADTAGFSVLTPHEGSDSWSYTDDETGCVVGYWTGSLAAPSGSDGDQTASDQLLATQFGVAQDEIDEYVEDGAGPFTTPSEVVETRAVLGVNDERGTSYIIASRVFLALGTGLVASLECPPSVNTSTEWAALAVDPAAFRLTFATG